MLQLTEQDDSFLVQTGGEFVGLLSATSGVAFLDFETSSGDPKLESTSPWRNCSPIGFAMCGETGAAYFVPWGIVLDRFADFVPWLRELPRWVNHYIKYDAHVILNNTQLTVDDLPQELFCTKVGAQLIDSDRKYKGGYTLEVLLKQWCKKSIKKKHLLAPYIGPNNKDYGKIPLDILAIYACGDVLGNRELYYEELERMPDDSQELLRTEIAVTKLLVEVEQAGLETEPVEVAKAAIEAITKGIELEEKLCKIVGKTINPNSPADLYDLFCNVYGQPVRKWTNLDRDGKKTDKSNPSFDKEAIKEYEEALETPEELRTAIAVLSECRKEYQHASLFYIPWQTQHVNKFLHGTYEQNITTGRMSCSDPNEQQLDKRAKSLIIPGEDWFFLSFDYAQIEFRFLMHYVQNRFALEAYANDPDTDFHDFTAESAEIPRKGAKRINFLIGYGGGRKLTLRKLAFDFREMKLGLTDAEILKRADSCFDNYHATFPEIKTTSKKAEILARRRGYIRNAAGRRLQLPGPIHNIAFDKDGKKIDLCHLALGGRVTQSLASDLAKNRAVYVTRKNGPVKSRGGKLCALVHDEFLFRFPMTEFPRLSSLACEIRDELEVDPFGLTVPIRASMCFSTVSWADCDKNKLDRSGNLVAA